MLMYFYYDSHEGGGFSLHLPVMGDLSPELGKHSGSSEQLKGKFREKE